MNFSIRQFLLLIPMLVFLSACSMVGGKAGPGQYSRLSSMTPVKAAPSILDYFRREAPVETVTVLPPDLQGQDQIEVEAELANPEVRKYVNEFTGEKRYFIERALESSQRYGTVVQGTLRAYELPTELQYIAFLESQYNPNARSAAGAVGMWQFTADTARSYGLTVSSQRDERCDVIRSTRAAAKHFRDLYRKYGDWALVAAAYNAGGGTVDRAMKNTGEKSFFEMARQGEFRDETREFVPKFLALAHVFQNLQRYGFDVGDPKAVSSVDHEPTKSWNRF